MTGADQHEHEHGLGARYESARRAYDQAENATHTPSRPVPARPDGTANLPGMRFGHQGPAEIQGDLTQIEREFLHHDQKAGPLTMCGWCGHSYDPTDPDDPDADEIFCRRECRQAENDQHAQTPGDQAG